MNQLVAKRKINSNVIKRKHEVKLCTQLFNQNRKTGGNT